ncbi:DUF2663 family protein [Aeribacillus alveayuensis]|uniref:DUF2663 family protein n=1 Tax=Aeribacillus alveayuensis TaxID=279215 RepID=A0ABT9VKJ7_9BACI|nr:hypothetical protein [Bacillus alveayuensis]
MEKKIKELKYTDSQAKQMLQELVKRKRVYEQVKNRCKGWQFLFFILTSLFFLYLYFFLYVPYNGQIGFVIHAFITESKHIFYILLLGSCYGMIFYYKKKEEKKEKEYHELRCEIIEKSTDLWKSDDAWREREDVFAMMKQQYDINLYFESK